MQQNVRLEIRWGKESFIIHHNLNDGVPKLKFAIQNIKGIQPQDQKLIFHGKQLKDDTNLNSLNIADGTVLMLIASDPKKVAQQQQQQQDHYQQNQSNHKQSSQQVKKNLGELGNPSFDDLPKVQLNRQLSVDKIIQPLTQQEIEIIFQVFEENKNKGLKHISELFKDMLVKKNMEEQDLLEHMQELEMLIEELGSHKSILNIHGMTILLEFAFFHQSYKVRKIALSIIGCISQNNQSIQKPTIEQGALVTIMYTVNQMQDQKLKEQYISVLGKLLRGEYIEGKQIFQQVEGIDFLLNLLTGFESSNMRQKVLYTLRDLIKWDEQIGNVVRKKCLQTNFALNQIYILKDDLLENSESRKAFIDILKSLAIYNPQALSSQELLNKLQYYQDNIIKNQELQDEIVHLKELLKVLKF